MTITTNWRKHRLPMLPPGLFFRYSALILLSLASYASWGQVTYYVASNGNDTNDGRSTATPFQKLAKVNTLTLNPGDVILLRRGDTFQGSLSIRQSGSTNSPIVIDAYGSGNKPVIMGSTTVSGWSRVNGSNVWQASCAACGSQVTGIYQNGTTLPLGRYPNLSDTNKGFLTVQSHSGKTQLTSQQGLSTNWTGGEVVVRPVQWILDRAPITAQNGNTLSLNNVTNYDLSDGWGFFIQNHPATLDQTGEWYYNPANKTIQLFNNQNDPNSQQISVTAFDAGVNLNNSSYVTVRNIRITQTLTAGIAANGGSNLTISGNDITNTGTNGIDISGANTNVLVENNLLQDINNTGFRIEGYQNVTFRGNTVQRVGLIPGRGKGGDGGYSGMSSTANQNVLVENNVVDNIGYVGVSVFSNTTIRNNRISNFCLTKSDGGGIYSYNGHGDNPGGLHILSNIIFNGKGVPEGMPASVYSGANGIFLDDCSQNSEIANNTVFNSRGKGVLLRGSSGITIKNNTIFSNDEEQLKLNYSSLCQLRNNVIQNNIFFSKYATQGVVEYETFQNDLGQYGQFDYNYYARPFEDLFKIRAIYNPGSGVTGNNFTLAEWQSKWGKDLNSANSPITYKTKAVSQTGATLLDQPFSNNTNGWNAYSIYGNGRIDWDNSNRLDGGSMRLSFASSSNKSDSYLLAFINIGAVTKGKTYQLLFDGVASGADKRIQVYPRQLSGSYRDLADRTSFIMSANRQSYEATFVANADESNAILLIQVDEDGKTAWIDNLKLREATLTDVNPDDNIKLYYNDTFQNITQSLDATYRDVKNNVYTGQVTIAPFSSIVLMKETNSTQSPPPVTLREPENPANTTGGIDYKYYEGSWNALPNFDALTPVKSGVSSDVNLSVRNRDQNYGLRYTGYVSVPADGTYTFYTSSDDGSKLLIGTTEVVNNDGNHGTQERSGTIGLKAGVHALTILFYQGGSEQALTVSYSGPNLSKQVIPTSAYVRVNTGGNNPSPTAGTGTGLRADYFNNPNVTAPVVVSRVDATVNFDWGNGSPASGVNTDGFSARWTGQLEAPVTGSYTFSTLGDDGVRLWVNGTLLINDWNAHAPQANTGASVMLTAGQKYDIKMEYFDSYAGAVVQLLWAYPGQAQQIIPQTRLYPAAGSSDNPSPTAGTGTGLRADYFNNPNVTAPVVVSRVDATVNFDWSNGSPASGVNTDRFSARWTGQVEAPVTGSYTFSTLSDDGVRLWVNGVLLIDDWNGHAPKANTGASVMLTAAQKYDIKLEYFDDTAGAVVQLLWTYPGQAQQIIPQTRLYPAASSNNSLTAGTGTGLRADYFNNPNVTAPVVVSRVDATVNFDWGNGSPASGVNTDRFSARWTGQVEASVTGSYTFSTLGDDGVRLWVNGTLLIDDWNSHAPKANNGASVMLTAGQKYDIRMEYFDDSAGAVVQLLWAYPGQAQQIIPQTRLYPAASSSGARLSALEEVKTDEKVVVKVFPIPARDEVRVRYEATQTGNVILQLTTLTGQAAIQTLHPVVRGENLIRVSVGALNRGTYVLTLIQDRQRITRKVLLTE